LTSKALRIMAMNLTPPRLIAQALHAATSFGFVSFDMIIKSLSGSPAIGSLRMASSLASLRSK
jgi:hypothetical protein